MTLLFTEGMGIYGPTWVAANIQKKWDAVAVNSGGASIGAGRHASGTPNRCFQLYGTPTYMDKTFDVTPGNNTFVVGLAINRNNTTIASKIFHIYDASGNELAYAVWDVAGTITLFLGNGVSILTTSAVFTAADTWYYLEVKLQLNSGTGTAVVRKNGVVVTSATVNTTWASAQFKKFRLYGFANSNNLPHRYQDLYILDTSGAAPLNDFLGDVRIETLLPSAVGAVEQWSPTPVANLLSAVQALLEGTGATGWILDPIIGSNNPTYTGTRSSPGYSGSGGLMFTTSGNGVAAVCTAQGTAAFPATPGLPYSLGFKARNSQGSSGGSVQAGVRWFDSSGAAISTTLDSAVGLSNTGSWSDVAGLNMIAPAGTAYASPVIRGEKTGGSGSLNGEADHIQFVQAATLPAFQAPHYGMVSTTPSTSELYVSGDTAGLIDTYGHTDLETVAANILTVRPALTLARTTAGARTIGAIARVGGVNYQSGTTITPDDTINVLKTKQVDFLLNPATGAAWTVAQVNAAEFGPKIVT